MCSIEKKTQLTKRIIDLSYKHKLGHIGSCLSVVSILRDIYEFKDDMDLVVLSPGHMALAWYIVLEDVYGYDAEKLLLKHGGHPNRDIEFGLTCSTGSLGLAASIAVGMAIAEPTKKVYCVVSDGECAEGIIWEALRFTTDSKLDNLEWHVIMNGWSASKEVDTEVLSKRLLCFNPDIKLHLVNSDIFDVSSGVDAHCHILNESEYKHILEKLECK